MNKQYNNQPLVSIIINCYNGEDYLEESIKSVLSQTYKNWEIIFWDNQSKDNSAKIFRSYNDKRFKYYYAPQHTSLYQARNEAIKKSSGEFIAFLDVDDFWENDKLELQIPLFKDLEVGVVYGNYFIYNQKLNTKKIFLKKNKYRGLILSNLLKKYNIGLVTIVIRKIFLEKLKLSFDNRFNIIGDFDLMIRLSTKYKFDYIDKPIATYRLHEKNESLLNKPKHINELKIWRNQMIGYPEIYKNENFYNLNEIINSLEIINLILNNESKKARLLIKISKNPIKKIKYLVASFLPIEIVKKFIEF